MCSDRGDIAGTDAQSGALRACNSFGSCAGTEGIGTNQRTLGDMIMKKNTLLIAVAAAALAVGSGTAFAQAPHQGGQKSDSAVQSNPASKNAPAEKMQGADHQKGAGNKAETTGQGSSQHQNQ